MTTPTCTCGSRLDRPLLHPCVERPNGQHPYGRNGPPQVLGVDLLAESLPKMAAGIVAPNGRRASLNVPFGHRTRPPRGWLGGLMGLRVRSRPRSRGACGERNPQEP